ncbi:hypothetical protein DICA0_B13080 [Diutina catenulata]
MTVRGVAVRTLDDELTPVLILSDPNECNENLSIVIKAVLDNLYLSQDAGAFTGHTYETLSCYALKVVTSNLFVKNYRFCLGKLLSLLSALNEQDPMVTDPPLFYQGECLKEFICVCMLLLLKTKNSPGDSPIPVAGSEVFRALSEFKFVDVFARFIAHNIRLVGEQCSSYVLLKFSCDIFFEYLYHYVTVSEPEFAAIERSAVVDAAVDQLLDNENFNHYDIDAVYESEAQLVAYEEFKLLLLINEQYLMRGYRNSSPNAVFEVLRRGKLAGFANLAIYHLNREESQIIKVLILKFLYLVFSTPATATSVYMNDLRILIDICLRELDDLDYTDPRAESRVLVIDYLRVLVPLLKKSQVGAYKSSELVATLRALARASAETSKDSDDVISRLANEVLSVDWVQYAGIERPRSPSDLSESSSIVDIEQAFTRMASVRTSTRADYHRHTTSHNDTLRRQSTAIPEDMAAAFSGLSVSSDPPPSLALANNGNVFLSARATSASDPAVATPAPAAAVAEAPTKNILDLPTEYLLSKPLPKVPVPERSRRELYQSANSSSSSVNSMSSLARKAMKKRAPAPPPPSASPRTSPHPAVRKSLPQTPPPPPPPRRRRA